MQKILTVKQIKEHDAYTIKHEPVASIDLMERACRAFVSWFTERFDVSKKIGIICGAGNNGGDGLGIARLLLECSYPVNVWIVRGSVPESEDFKINLQRLRNKIDIHEIVTESDKELFNNIDVLIDAIFGSGLSRPPEGIYAQAINCVNQSGAVRIAVDIPSGLMADQQSSGNIVKAHHTISFQSPKIVFMFPGYREFVGKWSVVDIGLSKAFLKDAEASQFYVQQKDGRRILRHRSVFDHKGNYGHALLVAGSLGRMGAAVLGGRGALRSGVGLLSLHSPRCGYTILQTAVPEAMVSIDKHEEFLSEVPALENYSAIGIGPGLGQAKETVNTFSKLLEQYNKPMVIDADALNILSTHSELMHKIPVGSILTPHPKEFERMMGEWSNDFERLEKQKQLSTQLNSVVVVKGAYTSIVTPDGNVYFNSTGNPGMATGGSGDVLTGILTSLLAQRYTSLEAAILGVYLHGLSGDLAAREVGMDSLVASDLVEFLPTAFKKVKF